MAKHSPAWTWLPLLLAIAVCVPATAAAQSPFPGAATGVDIRFPLPDLPALPPGAVRTADLNVASKGQVWWFRVDVLRAQPYIIRTVSPNIDTVLQLFGPGSHALRVARDDDGGGGRTSRIRAELQEGPYWIEVSNSGATTGKFTLEVTEENTLKPTASAPMTQTLATATSPSQREGWYRLFAPATGRYEIRTLNAGFDAQLALYTAGNTTAPLATDDDSGGDRNPKVERELKAAEYWIKISGYGNRTGKFTLSVVAPGVTPTRVVPGLESPAMRVREELPPGPADVFTRLTAAAASPSFAGLNELCDPTAVGDGFVRRMCDVPGNRADQQEFIDFFSGGQFVSASMVNDDSLKGSYADIVATFGRETKATVTLRTVQRSGVWRLHSLRSVTSTRPR